MTITSDVIVDEALARSVVYRFLSVSLQCTPPPSRAGVAAVVAALGHLDGAAAGPLAAVASHLDAVRPPTVDELSQGFVRLFGHTARGLVCPYETEYGSDNAFHQPQQLADIAGYYLAFGLQPAASFRVDHVACECEFMDFLNRKEAVFAARDDAGPDVHATIEVTRRAARDFLRDHLGRFGRTFATRLATEDPGGHFGVIGHVLLAFLDQECDHADVDSGPTGLPLRPDVPDETPMACGGCGECR